MADDEDLKMDDLPETSPPSSSSNKKEEDLTSDGGVLKKIQKEGEDWKKPPKGSEVKVHYVGKLLDGTEFDSSRKNDTPFTFKLEEGQVIKGWDIGVKTMKKGEIALFTIRQDYAYGERGAGDKIPPNATLQFEVELLSWIEETDVTKDGGVLKKTLAEGEGYDKPKDDSTVKVHYVGTLADGTVFESTRDGEPKEFIVGAEQVIDGLDKAVESMKKGEKALVTIQPNYGYGSTGSEDKKVPPNAVLTYEIELVSFQKEKESWDMNTEEKFQVAHKKKAEGNELYKIGKYKRAIDKYKKAVSFFEYDSSLSDEDKAKAKQLKLPVYLNLAACQLKLKDSKETIENAKKALEIEPGNVKALFRRGSAYLSIDDWESAKVDLTKALELDKGNKEIQRELTRLNQKIQQQDKKDRKVYANLFQRLSKEEEEDEQKQKREQEEQQKREQEEKQKREQEEKQKREQEEQAKQEQAKQEQKEQPKQEQEAPMEVSS